MKRLSHMVRALGLAGAIFAWQGPAGYAADPGVLLLSSNQAAAAGRYGDAITGYEELLAAGAQSAAIHYNLGIAHFKNNQLGAAIFHFCKAWRLDPRDGDIRFNLAYARKKTEDKIEDKRPLLVVYGDKYLPINSKEALYLAFFSVLFAVVLGVTHIYRKHDIVRWSLRLVLALALISFAAYLGRFFIDQTMGVVTAKTADVYSGQGENNVLLFTLHEGAEFTVEDEEPGGWLRIRLNDGKRGWIARADIIAESWAKG